MCLLVEEVFLLAAEEALERCRRRPLLDRCLGGFRLIFLLFLVVLRLKNTDMGLVDYDDFGENDVGMPILWSDSF